MPHSPRLACCNELFQDRSFPEACAAIRRAGFGGIELAPFTLAEDAGRLSPAQIAELRKVIADAGLEFVGLHWLLVSPPGLHATTSDTQLRRRTWDYIRSLIDLSGQLAAGSGSVMVLGSPKQRSAVPGHSAAEATRTLAEQLAAVAPQAAAHNVKFLLEPLSPEQTDVVTTLAEAVSIVREINSPAIRTMFDVHNAREEHSPHEQLLSDFMPYIEHVHVNELDGREPGMGNYDFEQLLTRLDELAYGGWISVEAFDFTRDPVTVADRAFQTLNIFAPDLSSHPTL